MGQNILGMIKSYYTFGLSKQADKNKEANGLKTANLSEKNGSNPKLDDNNPDFIGPQRPTAEDNNKNSYEFNGNPMSRRMDSIGSGDPSNPMDPAHEQTVTAGLNSLSESGLPKDVQDHYASLMIAGLTHGRQGLSYDHLITEPPNYSNDLEVT